MSSSGKLEVSNCPGCGVEPNRLHKFPCQLEQCPYCGGQMIGCICYDHVVMLTLTQNIAAIKNIPQNDDRVPWNGLTPGTKECRDLDWYTKSNDNGKSWVECESNEEGAREDLMRFFTHAKWDRETKRFIVDEPEPEQNIEIESEEPEKKPIKLIDIIKHIISYISQ